MFIKVCPGCCHPKRDAFYLNTDAIVFVREFLAKEGDPQSEDWFLVMLVDEYNYELSHKHNKEFLVYFRDNQFTVKDPIVEQTCVIKSKSPTEYETNKDCDSAMKIEQHKRIIAITKKLSELLGDEWQIEEKVDGYPHGQIYVGWKFSCDDFWTGGSMSEIDILGNGYESDDEFCQDMVSGLLDIKEGRVLCQK